MTKATKTVLITDLDDTLWDWLNIWYSSFYPMFQEILRITDTSEDDMIPVIKKIHERVGTSEYTFLLEDIESAYGRASDVGTVTKKYDEAIHAFRRGRKNAQKLFPDVWDTLQHVKGRGAKIVGYTESMAFATIQRIKAFGLDGVFDVLYSPKDHDHPDGLNLERARSLDGSNYTLQHTVHHNTPPGELKPNPDILQSIIRDLGASKDDCVYVGDKLVKDVTMAIDAGVLDAWAKYGSNIDKGEYAFLRRVTHWTAKAVDVEAKTKVANISAAVSDADVKVTITLDNSFGELLKHVTFERFKAS